MNKQHLTKPYMSGFPVSLLSKNSRLMQLKSLINMRATMKRRKTDTQTIDMFYIPPPPVTSDGGLACCRVEIARIMALSMKGRGREEIACKINKITGMVLSKYRLNQMSAESAEAHTPPLDQAVAFDVVTGTNALAEFFASKVGGKLVIGKETLDVNLAKKLRQLEELHREIKMIKRAIGESL